jgi:hypothetical protein
MKIHKHLSSSFYDREVIENVDVSRFACCRQSKIDESGEKATGLKVETKKLNLWFKE